MIHFQASYNVICYNDQTRLRTAVELLNATKDIESQLHEVSRAICKIFLLFYNARVHRREFVYENISVGSMFLLEVNYFRDTAD